MKIEFTDGPKRDEVTFDDMKAGDLFVRQENLHKVFMKFRLTREGLTEERPTVRSMRLALRDAKGIGVRFYIDVTNGVVFFDACNFNVILYEGTLIVHEKKGK